MTHYSPNSRNIDDPDFYHWLHAQHKAGRWFQVTVEGPSTRLRTVPHPLPDLTLWPQEYRHAEQLDVTIKSVDPFTDRFGNALVLDCGVSWPALLLLDNSGYTSPSTCGELDKLGLKSDDEVVSFLRWYADKLPEEIDFNEVPETNYASTNWVFSTSLSCYSPLLAQRLVQWRAEAEKDDTPFQDWAARYLVRD